MPTTDTKIEKDRKDLVKKLSENRKALQDFRFDVAGSKMKTVTEAKKIRKEIARILTKLGKK
tara:strand:- start:600 stop:785 length:186 start_codon:yes stop_codon:yes gene_type:complete